MTRVRRGTGSRRGRREPGNLVFGTIGWLFADLMVALAMAFLVATTVGVPSPPEPAPTPTPSHTPTPSRTPEPGLEQRPVEVTMKVDWAGLLAGDDAAEAKIRRKVREDVKLHGRRAGLVLAFGGAGDTDPGRALNIAGKANAVLKDLGKSGYVFDDAVFRPFLSHRAVNTLVLDIYLFKK
ncbi:hypothetical protein ACIBKY_34690 [Nonomuraea sp. NPDC050394]|uniref:hypothetical protein n=1 Tax=Nonomuraea sp. NPDC050394 TaxID=3364363 RepID=UPI0037B7944F